MLFPDIRKTPVPICQSFWLLGKNSWVHFLYVEAFEKNSILPAQLNPYLIFNRGSRPRTILQDSRIGQL